MWHRGYVRHRNEWIPADDFAQVVERDPRVEAYVRQRAEAADTPAGQLELASWCRNRKLLDRERAHLTYTLRLDPDNNEARRRLGFRRVGGAWVHPDETASARQQQREDRQNLEKWRSKMEDLLVGLKHRSELKRKMAESRVAELRDPEATRAMEVVLATDSERIAMQVIETLNKIDDDRAALALARLSVLSNWETVRDAAANKLVDRPLDSFVPEMLAGMFRPIRARVNFFTDRDGRIVYRHSFLREGQTENQLIVRDTAYRRIGIPSGDDDDTLERAISDAANRARDAELSVAQQNLRNAEFNKRITRTISLVSQQDLPNDVDLLWRWWNQYNEVYTDGGKQTRTVQQNREVQIFDRTVQALAAAGDQNIAGQVSQPLDCLAAGTMIWTSNGMTPVEELRVGDMVLAQNVETGELAYKPIMQTTIRPASKLIRFTAGNQTVQASGGHPFWVAGEGWIKARDLQAGMELHCVTNTACVQSVERDEEQQSYNIIVADFNTYFVGEQKILSHDNTIRQRTRAIVPGLSE